MRNDRFISKWSKTRAKGKGRFIFRYGFILCGILGGIGFLMLSTLIEGLRQEQFNIAEFTHTMSFMLRVIITVFVFPAAGILIGISSWNANERKYKSLTSRW
ncbi:MAG TPA: hypothetical protein VHP30_02530 [Ignavibacteriales bacterium]|nr:hypothetical protein [Ignavibacteriales bacterium]